MLGFRDRGGHCCWEKSCAVGRCLSPKVLGLAGLRVQGLGFRVLGFWGLGLRIQGLGLSEFDEL